MKKTVFVLLFVFVLFAAVNCFAEAVFFPTVLPMRKNPRSFFFPTGIIMIISPKTT